MPRAQRIGFGLLLHICYLNTSAVLPSMDEVIIIIHSRTDLT